MDMATPSATALNSMNMLRISGLASGLDTESIVESLMRVERMKYDKLDRQKQLMDWTRDANLEVNNLLRDFREKYLSVLSPDTNILSSSSLLSYKVTADSSVNAVITAGTNALPGTHQIDSITSIATGSNAASVSSISAGPLSSSTTLEDLALTTPLTFDGDGNISFAINGQAFTFSSTDTLKEVINVVNANADAGVQMSYSSLTGKITIAGKTTGSASSLEIQNISGNAFSDTDAAFGIAQGTYSNGTDAVLSIDGITVTRDSNYFTIDGVNYNLKHATGTPIGFSVERDVDGAVQKVKGFIDAYNDLIEKLQVKLEEKRDAEYMPLNDEQRAEMSETQITQWENRAKAGLLQNDSHIAKLLRDLRRAFYDNVSSAGVNASSLGLSTITWQTNGTILVDEAKLREALVNNPQQVAQVLTNMSYDPDISTRYDESGAFARMSNSIQRYLSDYSGYRKESSDDAYRNLEGRITAALSRLQRKEEMYWSQYTRLEQYMSQMNAQSSWLSQQFSSMFGDS